MKSACEVANGEDPGPTAPLFSTFDDLPESLAGNGSIDLMIIIDSIDLIEVSGIQI